MALAAVLGSGAALAADATFKDQIKCSDFTRNSNGSWHTEAASFTGPGNTQTNYFDATITAKNGEIFTALNEKCGAGH